MTFDPEHFIGLAAPGAFPAPPDAAVIYAYRTPTIWLGGGTGPHSGEPGEIDFGGGPPGGDYQACYHVGPLPGAQPELHQDPGLWADQPAEVTLTLAETHGFPASGGSLVDWTAIATPPDYVTLEVVASPGADPFFGESPSEIIAAQTICPVIEPVPGDTGDPPAYHQTEEAHVADISWSMTFAMSAATFVPDVVNVGGTPTAQDGETRPLSGWLVRSTADYTGDSANTASNYLWPPGEVGDIIWDATGVFHKAIVNGIAVYARPYWKTARPQVCFV